MLLERVAQLIRFTLASTTQPDAWNQPLYEALNSAVTLAIPGAILWAAWTFGFYYLGINFVTISWAIGVPAHLLGACWYLALFFKWYQLALAQRGR